MQYNESNEANSDENVTTNLHLPWSYYDELRKECARAYNTHTRFTNRKQRSDTSFVKTQNARDKKNVPAYWESIGEDGAENVLANPDSLSTEDVNELEQLKQKFQE